MKSFNLCMHTKTYPYIHRPFISMLILCFSVMDGEKGEKIG